MHLRFGGFIGFCPVRLRTLYSPMMERLYPVCQNTISLACLFRRRISLIRMAYLSISDSNVLS